MLLSIYRALRNREVGISLRSGTIRIRLRHWFLLVAWIVLTVFAFQTERDIFFRLSYLIAAIIAFSFFWATYSIWTFSLERRLVTPRTQVGRVAEERFLVHNTGSLIKLWIEVRDEVELPNYPVSRVLSSLRAHSHWSWSERTVCRRRGRFHLGPITITSGDPFGIFLLQRRLPNTTLAITVYPATVDLTAFELPTGQLPGGDAAHQRTHYTTTDVSGTRDYAPGDSFNRIHWRSTARANRLIVKEFELDPAADVWIYVDMERAVQAGEWWREQWDSRDLSQLWFAEHQLHLPTRTEEYLVTIAASVAKYFVGKNRSVGLVAYGAKREIVQPDRGERQLNRLLEVLAVLNGEGNTPFGHVFGVESAHLGRNTTVVAVTPSAELDWLKAAQEAKRRGLRVVTVLVDASTFGAARGGVSAAGELLAGGIPTYVVHEGDDLSLVLSR